MQLLASVGVVQQCLAVYLHNHNGILTSSHLGQTFNFLVLDAVWCLQSSDLQANMGPLHCSNGCQPSQMGQRQSEVGQAGRLGPLWRLFCRLKMLRESSSYQPILPYSQQSRKQLSSSAALSSVLAAALGQGLATAKHYTKTSDQSGAYTSCNLPIGPAAQLERRQIHCFKVLAW